MVVPFYAIVLLPMVSFVLSGNWPDCTSVVKVESRSDRVLLYSDGVACATGDR
ncbi:MAG: hypothetical protein M2R45_04772 [Verrucomicrobia subdivision 3 bacterium]|nr:hypothetical protein [Limisphaerales bacterium]MCS1415102.1 hypothetical protein [Limisphaerales bacterium]